MRNIAFSQKRSNGALVALGEILAALDMRGLHWLGYRGDVNCFFPWPVDLIAFMRERESLALPIEIEMIERIASHPGQCIDVTFAGYRDKSDQRPELLFGIEDNCQWEIHYRDPARIDFAALEQFSPFVEDNPWQLNKDGSVSNIPDFPFLRFENEE
ncbi:MAG: hypothetical protein Q4C87_03700 [Actinomycetaceae bacterium]|nr:hypothetical protein [Actinomycetaceae bacterium]